MSNPILEAPNPPIADPVPAHFRRALYHHGLARGSEPLCPLSPELPPTGQTTEPPLSQIIAQRVVVGQVEAEATSRVGGLEGSSRRSQDCADLDERGVYWNCLLPQRFGNLSHIRLGDVAKSHEPVDVTAEALKLHFCGLDIRRAEYDVTAETSKP